jgi:hypothetical protein
MTHPKSAGDPVPVAVTAALQAVVADPTRLGLVWNLRPATVVDAKAPRVVFDGDSADLTVINLMGPLANEQRVYVLEIPPGGNFIIGSPNPPASPYLIRQQISTAQSSVTFNIPSNTQRMLLTYTVRTSAAVQAQGLLYQVNGDSSASYFYEYLQGQNVTAAATSGFAGTAGILGLCTGSLATAGVFASGTATWCGVDSPHGNALGMTFQSQAFGSTAANFFTVAGGGFYYPAGPYTSLTITPQAGNFDVGSDFLLEGILA